VQEAGTEAAFGVTSQQGQQTDPEGESSRHVPFITEGEVEERRGEEWRGEERRGEENKDATTSKCLQYCD
jgi:hypothetical protein